MLISHLTGIWIVNFKLKLFTAFCDPGVGRLGTVGFTWLDLCWTVPTDGARGNLENQGEEKTLLPVPSQGPEHTPFPWVSEWSRSVFETPWAVAYQAPPPTYQAPPSTGFSKREYWSGLPFPSPGDLPDPGIEPRSPALWADALTSEPPGKPTPFSYQWQFFRKYG